jgi:predicted transport protein
MPLFQLKGAGLSKVRPRDFRLEKELQQIIENNLGPVFSCRLVASEFPTGERHGGRIDTLALSEENNPVIIEYKKGESSDLINQSLFYLSWIQDHRGDFELAVQKSLRKAIEVDWSSVRVMCIASGYKRYDLHAVQVMGQNIELWQYRLYENGAFFLEEVFSRHDALSIDSSSQTKNPVMVEAGKRAALTRATGVYTVDEHLKKLDKELASTAQQVREFALSLGEDVSETPKKLYISYKVAENFMCMEVQHQKILLYLKLDPSKIRPMPPNGRDVRKIGHFGTGDLEIAIRTADDAQKAEPFIQQAYENVGG